MGAMVRAGPGPMMADIPASSWPRASWRACSPKRQAPRRGSMPRAAGVAPGRASAATAPSSSTVSAAEPSLQASLIGAAVAAGPVAMASRGRRRCGWAGLPIDSGWRFSAGLRASGGRGGRRAGRRSSGSSRPVAGSSTVQTSSRQHTTTPADSTAAVSMVAGRVSSTTRRCPGSGWTIASRIRPSLRRSSSQVPPAQSTWSATASRQRRPSASSSRHRCPWSAAVWISRWRPVGANPMCSTSGPWATRTSSPSRPGANSAAIPPSARRKRPGRRCAGATRPRTICAGAALAERSSSLHRHRAVLRGCGSPPPTGRSRASRPGWVSASSLLVTASQPACERSCARAPRPIPAARAAVAPRGSTSHSAPSGVVMASRPACSTAASAGRQPPSPRRTRRRPSRLLSAATQAAPGPIASGRWRWGTPWAGRPRTWMTSRPLASSEVSVASATAEPSAATRSGCASRSPGSPSRVVLHAGAGSPARCTATSQRIAVCSIPVAIQAASSLTPGASGSGSAPGSLASSARGG